MLSEFIRSELEELRRANLVREPRIIDRVRGPFVTIDGREYLSFCSNDYLGIGQDPRLAEAASRVAREYGWGAVSARSLSGTTRWHAELEEAIAEFKGAPAALYFPSGYAANLGLLGAIADRDTLIVSDELNHASLIDGCRLSRAKVEVYPHRDVAAAGREGLRLLRAGDDRRARLWENIRLLGAPSPIHTVILGSNERALEASRRLFELGFFVPAIRPPTVAEGTARLRITVTAMHER